MKRYKPYKFNESITNANELASEIEKTILQIFPKSSVEAEFKTNIYSSIMVYFTLGKDKSEYAHGIYQNDMAYMIITVNNKGKEFPKDGTIIGDVQVENKSGSFLVKSESPYLAYSRVKVPFRKTSGSPEKIVEYIKKYFMTFKKALQDNRDRITDKDLALIGDKF